MEVSFVVMPFADVERPAIGVSLLKASLARSGFASRVHYCNFELAEEIGLDLYRQLSNGYPADFLVGEWFFADLVYGDQLPPADAYVAHVLGRSPLSSNLVARILEARACRAAFVERCARDILAQHADVVGFTTTFHQTCASLAVARRLKEADQPPIVVFGGANCEGEMGLQMVQSCPWIDYVCSGEGDVAFPTLLAHLRDGDPGPVPGVLTRAERTMPSAPPILVDMDSLAIPDYSDYFERLPASVVPAQPGPPLLVETSRGCWWGEKHHCTFCGLNGATLSYRSKSAERVLDELATLSSRYGVARIECVDNILDLKYLKTVFPYLIDRGLELDLFYETKANLRYDQLVVLRNAGVRAIQPGIESLSNAVLQLMRKGCTALQNIQLLRWCDELGIVPAWNIIFGFPGESPAEYAAMADLIPQLSHLQAPVGCAPFRLDRFSPYFDAPAEFGLVRVRPAAATYYVFPFGRRVLERLAYFFDFDFADGRDPVEYARPMARAVEGWWAAGTAGPEARPRLNASPQADGLLVTDTRSCALAPEHYLDGLAARIYQLCDSIQSPSSIARGVGEPVGDLEVRAILERLVAARLMVEIDGQVLSLAVMRDRAPLPGKVRTGNEFFQPSEASAPVTLLSAL